MPRAWAHLSLPSTRTSLLHLGWGLGLGALITGKGAELGELLSIIPGMSWEGQGDNLGTQDVGFGTPCIWCFILLCQPSSYQLWGISDYRLDEKSKKYLNPLLKARKPSPVGRCNLNPTPVSRLSVLLGQAKINSILCCILKNSIWSIFHHNSPLKIQEILEY